jgi:hypothetical protein
MTLKLPNWYMPIVKTIKGDFYQIIYPPCGSKAEAEKLARRREKEHPSGNQKVIPTKDKKFWGVYEKVTYDHIPEQHRYPGEKRK